jgi:hypothetical protein
MSSSKNIDLQRDFGQVFVRVYKLEIQMYIQSCWYFRPSFVTVAPLTFSLVQYPPPPFPM